MGHVLWHVPRRAGSGKNQLAGQREFQIQQILAQGSGQNLSENLEIFEHFFFRQGQKSLLQLGLLILFTVHVAAADTGDGAVSGGEQLLDLGNFLFCHNIPPRSEIQYTPNPQQGQVLLSQMLPYKILMRFYKCSGVLL